MHNPGAVLEAARIIRDAQALVIAAGAGMGVDSGLPDFRGPEGFWKAYPPYRSVGTRFEEAANPRCFLREPRKESTCPHHSNQSPGIVDPVSSCIPQPWSV